MIRFSLAFSVLLGASGALAADTERLETGAALYGEHCAACHGENLEGAEDWQTYNEDGSLPPPPHDESGHTWHHDDDLLFRYTKLGGEETIGDMPGFVSGMPAFSDVMSDDEIWMVLDFIKSTWPPHIKKAQAKMSEMAAKMRAVEQQMQATE